MRVSDKRTSKLGYAPDRNQATAPHFSHTENLKLHLRLPPSGHPHGMETRTLLLTQGYTGAVLAETLGLRVATFSPTSTIIGVIHALLVTHAPRGFCTRTWHLVSIC